MTQDRPFVSTVFASVLTLKRRVSLRSRLVAGWKAAVRRRFGALAINNAIEDRQWGGWCGGTIESPYKHMGATATQSTDYAPLAAIFESGRVPIGDDDVLVDLGCGKGRVINYWLRLGRGRRLVGIELDERIASLARKRLQRYPRVEIITGSAVDQLPDDGTLFYMFNPFEAAVVAKLKRRLDALGAMREPGAPSIRVVYYYCRHLEAFEDDPEWTITELPTGDHHRAVLLSFLPATYRQRHGAADCGSLEQANPNFASITDRSRQR